MPHSFLKDFRSNIGYYTTLAITSLEIYAREYAEKELQKIIVRLVQEACPPVPDIEQTFRKLDTIENITNNTVLKVDAFNRVVEPLEAAGRAAQAAQEVISHFGLPVAIPITPPPGSPLFSLPQGILATQAKLNTWLNSTVNTLQDEAAGVITVVSGAKARFQPILDKIEIVRNLTEGCATNPNLSLEQRQSIIEGLKTDTKSLANNTATSYVSKTNGNTYTLEIITDPNSPQTAPRRQAVAKDLRGVVVLKGPLSFSSSAEVLLKELKFRIDNQLP